MNEVTTTDVLNAIRPGQWVCNIDDTLAGVQLKEGVPPITQQEFDAALISLANIKVITNAQLKRQLNATGQLATAQQLVTAAGGLTMELWYGAATFNITDPELVALATTAPPNGLGMTPDQLQTFFNDAAKL